MATAETMESLVNAIETLDYLELSILKGVVESTLNGFSEDQKRETIKQTYRII